MFESLNDFLRKPTPKSAPLIREPAPTAAGTRRDAGERKQTFSKVFRWRLPAGRTAAPSTVEVVGSFTNWQKVALTRDSAVDGWHVTLHHIQGNRTHHYMLLVDGKPTYDSTCDGYAIPHGGEEERYQLGTEKGPRVLMLFAQTK